MRCVARAAGGDVEVTGADAIQAEYAKWFVDPDEFEQPRRRRTEDAEVVDYRLAWTEEGVARTAHHLHLVTVEAGLIVAGTVTGARRPEPPLAERAGNG